MAHEPRRRRLRLSYANVGATLALVLGLTGGAFAATASAPSQIHACYSKRTGNLRIVGARKKCQRGEKALAWNQQGPRGFTGLQGPRGTNGTNGAQGIQGPAGPFPTGTLPSGATIKGTYQVTGQVTSSGDRVLGPISFVWEMPAQLTTNVIASGGSSTAACPGTADHPAAAPGNFCMYREAALEQDVSQVQAYTPTGGGYFTKTGFTGVIVDVTAGAVNTDTDAGGTWAATAP